MAGLIICRGLDFGTGYNWWGICSASSTPVSAHTITHTHRERLGRHRLRSRRLGRSRCNIGKVNSRTKFLARVAKSLDTETVRSLATSLIQCHYDYACFSWCSGTTSNRKDKLQPAQNKLMRIIISGLNRHPVDLQVAEVKLLIVFKFIHDLAPSHLSGYDTFISHHTRASVANI